MPPSKTERVANSLLAGIPRKDYLRIADHLESITLQAGEILYQPGAAIRHMYFPAGTLISLLTIVDGDRPIEVVSVGRDGVVGVAVALGHKEAKERAYVQVTGHALRIRTAEFRKQLEGSAPLRNRVHSYTYLLITRMNQAVGCNRFHLVAPRLARKLLSTRDELGSPEFYLTHESLAPMLGVGRERITEAAVQLQRRNLIEYSRGHIRITDVAGLKAASCSCYGG